MFPLSSRCQVRSMAWFSPTSMDGSTWKERTSGNNESPPLALRPQNGETGTDIAGTAGIGILPSTPTRNPLNAGLVLAALQFLPAEALKLHGGALTLMVCAKAT